MNDYIIMTDSCVDLPSELAKKMGLVVLPLSVKIEEKVYYNYLDEKEITFKSFYDALRNKAKTQTSQATPAQFLELMKPILDAGKDILYIAFSSALSGTYNSSLIAKEELEPLYPNQKIILVDSLCASMGQGLLVTYAYKEKVKGKSLEEVAKWVEDNKINISHLFTVGDLNHLRRGGRLSPIKAIIGTILRVKPLLHVSSLGKLTVVDKSRGRMSSLDDLVNRMISSIDHPEGQTVYISHGDCLEDALYVKKQIMEKLPIKDFAINYIGPVIGSHSGLDTLAIFYIGHDRIGNDE